MLERTFVLNKELESASVTKFMFSKISLAFLVKYSLCFSQYLSLLINPKKG